MVSLRRKRLNTQFQATGFGESPSLIDVPFFEEAEVNSRRNDQVPEGIETLQRSPEKLEKVEDNAILEGSPTKREMVKESKKPLQGSPSKKHKVWKASDGWRQKQQVHHVEIDPERPLEVHAFLKQLDEDNKLNLTLMTGRVEGMPVKQWMENLYPHIFTVFPQNPRGFTGVADELQRNKLLYCYYWLFMFELKNIISMDANVTPEYLDSLEDVISNLEEHGFDCRFMRSEMLMVMEKVRKQHEITVADKRSIETRKVQLEGILKAIAAKEEASKKVETRVAAKVEGEEFQESNFGNEGSTDDDDDKTQWVGLEDKFVRMVLERYTKMLDMKQYEEERLRQVVCKMNRFHHGNAAVNCSGIYP